MGTANIDRECVKWSLTRDENNGRSLNFQAQKVVAVAYRRWSFTRDSHCKSLTGEVLVFWILGRFWKVVAHGGSTVENVTTRETFSKPVYTIWRFVYIFALYLLLSPKGKPPYENVGDARRKVWEFILGMVLPVSIMFNTPSLATLNETLAVTNVGRFARNP